MRSKGIHIHTCMFLVDDINDVYGRLEATHLTVFLPSSSAAPPRPSLYHDGTYICAVVVKSGNQENSREFVRCISYDIRTVHIFTALPPDLRVIPDQCIPVTTKQHGKYLLTIQHYIAFLIVASATTLHGTP